MRVIKFRAWDGEQMRYEFSVQANGDGVNCAGDIMSLPLMQFTGLHDKNGKEIYEGDIVKHKAENKEWEPLNDDSPLEVDAISMVEWRGHGFWLSNEYFGWEGEGLVNWENLEVIGNLYETPELIQTKTEPA